MKVAILGEVKLGETPRGIPSFNKRDGKFVGLLYASPELDTGTRFRLAVEHLHNDVVTADPGAHIGPLCAGNNLSPIAGALKDFRHLIRGRGLDRLLSKGAHRG